LLAVAVLFGVALLLSLATDLPFLDVLFESVSALATVGATTGLTRELDGPAQLIVIAAMFIGRLGPLTLVLALASRQRPATYRHAVESIRIS
jgi:trk system potassium uptake protein